MGARQQVRREGEAARSKKPGPSPEVRSCGENFSQSPRYTPIDVSLTTTYERAPAGGFRFQVGIRFRPDRHVRSGREAEGDSSGA